MRKNDKFKYKGCNYSKNVIEQLITDCNVSHETRNKTDMKTDLIQNSGYCLRFNELLNNREQLREFIMVSGINGDVFNDFLTNNESAIRGCAGDASFCTEGGSKRYKRRKTKRRKTKRRSTLNKKHR